MNFKRFPSGLMGTCCVPWSADFRFEELIFRRSVRRSLQSTPLLYVFGTAGEGYAVTEDQFFQVVRAFADEMRRGDAEPMVGVIHLSTATIIERIHQCRDLGVRRFQISLPCWGALNDRELFVYFEQICNRFPDCVFMHYNLPRTKRLITGKEYGRLAQEFPNLVATKNCGDSLSHIRGLIDEAPQLQHFLSEAGYVYGSLFGECSILVSLMMNWPKMRALYDAGRRHDIAVMTAIHREARTVLQTLFEAVPEGRIDGSYDKLYEKMYDPEYPLNLLPPYIGSTDAEFQSFMRTLSQRLPEWIPVAEERD